jgi:hypothetical protein
VFSPCRSISSVVVLQNHEYLLRPAALRRSSNMSCELGEQKHLSVQHTSLSCTIRSALVANAHGYTIHLTYTGMCTIHLHETTIEKLTDPILCQQASIDTVIPILLVAQIAGHDRTLNKLSSSGAVASIGQGQGYPKRQGTAPDPQGRVLRDGPNQLASGQMTLAFLPCTQKPIWSTKEA